MLATYLSRSNDEEKFRERVSGYRRVQAGVAALVLKTIRIKEIVYRAATLTTRLGFSLSQRHLEIVWGTNDLQVDKAGLLVLV
jgi:hypothetical protein